MKKKKLLALAMAFVMMATFNVGNFMVAGAANTATATQSEKSGQDIIITFDSEDFVSKINSIKLGENEITNPMSAGLYDFGYSFRYMKDGNTIKIGGVTLTDETLFKISAEGYEPLEVKMDKEGKLVNSGTGNTQDPSGEGGEESESQGSTVEMPAIELKDSDILMTFAKGEDVANISAVKIGETSIEYVSSGMYDWSSGSRYTLSDKVLKIGGIAIGEENIFTINFNDGEELVVKVDKEGNLIEPADTSTEDPSGEGGEGNETGDTQSQNIEKPAVHFAGGNIELTFSDKTVLEKIEKVIVKDSIINFMSSTNFPWVSTPRYTIKEDKILIGGIDIPTSKLLCTIEAEGYKPLTFDINEKIVAADGKKLYVRMKGSFEAALVNQKGYDAISGASTSVTQNNNSNVVVQAALVDEEKEPKEGDWKVLKDSGIVLNISQTRAELSAECGMRAVYSPFDSSITLAGTPTVAGEYQVKIYAQDEEGHTAESNTLPFRVYSGEEFLEDQLVLKNSTATQDGKYMYDMEPWAIKNFDDNDSTVTVPKDMKAIFGSHEAGTYGKLGYAIPFGSETTQKLIIPSGCNLTLVNVDVLSSVRIIVENGGKLSLRGTPIQGIVDVKSGGTFSMNYNDYNGSFKNGSAINGQLIMRDGSTLENSMIYSNTNFIPNGSGNGEYERINTDPVVVTEGNVNIKGKVYIRGDEAASYNGQKGLLVKDGTLNVPEGSMLAVYGGGRIATTSTGADAITLENGNITGDGTLVAIGGAGFFNNGGNGLSGNGNISVKNAYIEGGAANAPKDDMIVAGKAAAENVNITSENKKVEDGKVVKGTNNNPENPMYWNDLDNMPKEEPYIEAIKEETNKPNDGAGTGDSNTDKPNDGGGTGNDTDGDKDNSVDGNDNIKDADENPKDKPKSEKVKMISGINGTFVLGSKKGLVFRSSSDIENFIEVLVDGEKVAEDNYRVWEGSTYVKLKTKYLSTLEVGKHTIEIKSTDGVAKANFFISKSLEKDNEKGKNITSKDSKNNGANTGDSRNPLLWMFATIISLGAVFGIKRKRVK